MECLADHYRPSVGIWRETVCVCTRVCPCVRMSLPVAAWKIIIGSRQGCERERGRGPEESSIIGYPMEIVPAKCLHVCVCAHVCVTEREIEKESVRYSLSRRETPLQCMFVFVCKMEQVGGGTWERK